MKYMRVPRRVRGTALHFRVRVVGGAHDGQMVLMRPPLVREFDRGGVHYRVDWVAGRGYVALADIETQGLPIIAWRAWQVHEEPGALTTLRSGNDEAWSREGPIVAKCGAGIPVPPGAVITGQTITPDEPPRHDAPQFDCDCGVYCTTTLAALRRAGYSEPDVYGLIAIWGRVEEHDYGYRAQRAYPQAIIVNSKAASLGVFTEPEAAQKLRLRASDLERAYRVPTMLAIPERAIKVAAELIEARRLPTWADRAAPSDVRLYRTLARVGAN